MLFHNAFISGNLEYHQHNHDHHDSYIYGKPTPKPYYNKPTPKPYKTQVHYKHYEPLPPGPPYPIKYDNYEGDYDYEYYDSYEPPAIHFDPPKIKPYKHYSTVAPNLNFYTTPHAPTLKPYYSTTPAPYHSTHPPDSYYHSKPDPYYPYSTPEPYYSTPKPPPHQHHHHHAPPPHHAHAPVRHHHNSGPHFLDGVSAILGGATSGAVHPRDVGPILGSTLLQDIQDKVRSELDIGPPNQPFTDINVGATPPVPPPSTPLPFLPGFEPRVDVNPRSEPTSRWDGYATGSNDQPKKAQKDIKPPKPPKKIKKIQTPEPNGQLSFSELMSDFLSKPLPFNAAQKSRNLDSNSPPYG